MTTLAPRVQWIPIAQVNVVNPRQRNQRVFRKIIRNIETVGLKRPIIVTERSTGADPPYNLVCGQGRMEAYMALGQTAVPALVIAADPESCLIASLVENCARRQHNAIDLLQDISTMRTRGDSQTEIARKTGLSADYVAGIDRLLERGEKRLLRSVEAKVIPLSVAIEIADTDDRGAQKALQLAYERGELRGKKLIAAKQIVDVRKRQGKDLHIASRWRSSKISAAAVVRAYQDDAAHKREVVRRGNAAKDRLLLIVEALCRLWLDEQLMVLLTSDGLASLPISIAQRIDHRIDTKCGSDVPAAQ